MANTYTGLYYHIIYSTKNRRGWIAPDKEERVWVFFSGIARQNKMVSIRIGGIVPVCGKPAGAS